MSLIGPVIARQASRIGALTERLGQRVDVLALGVCDRAGHLPLAEPGLTSSNGACRLLRAADGWVALNLAREEDRDLVPAWLDCGFEDDAWALAERHVGRRTFAELRDRATLLGLPVAVVAERSGTDAGPYVAGCSTGGGRRALSARHVLDLSALWAGPLCGAILAAAGARVTRVESLRRPDPSRHATPRFFAALNGAKATLPLDLASDAGRSRLRHEVLRADVLITSARPRALAALGLKPDALFAERPDLVWAAITGYGASGAAAERVAFGDDAAAAGGLLRWTREGAPSFAGDALADPVTGLAAAAAVLEVLAEGVGGAFIDVSLAGCAAAAAAEIGAEAAA